MKLYIKEKFFSIADKFNVLDEESNTVYTVQGEVFSWGDKLHIYDAIGFEIGMVRQKVLSMLPRYFIDRNGQEAAEVIKKFTLLKQQYLVMPQGWVIQGDFCSHNYSVTSNGETIITVSKKWFTFGDSYELDIQSGVDPVLALSILMIIDACNDNSSSASAATQS